MILCYDFTKSAAVLQAGKGTDMEKIIGSVQQKIQALLEEKESILIAIDGSCTSGKSTLAEALAGRLDCNVLHMDDFFLRPEQRTPQRLAQTGGNMDYERFWEEVLQPLKEGKVFSYRPYDCAAGMLKEPVSVIPKAVTIVEGTYSQHPYFGDVYDWKLFLTVSPEIRENRILQRPVFLQRRFFTEWIPMEQTYFREFRIREQADSVLLPEDNQ